MTVLSNIITPSNVLTTTNTATVTNKTLTSPTVTGMVVSDGTANGVTYLNGSKVLTSGSMLVFDSSDRFIVGAGSAAIGNRIEVVANTSSQAIGIRGRAADGGGIISWHANAAATEYARITADNTSALSFGTGSSGTEGMRLNSTGLGIGTSSPTEKLHVAGALRVTGAQTTAGTGVYLQQASGTGGVSVYGPDNSTQGTFQVYTATANGGTGSTKVTIDSAGNLGLGVTPIASYAAYKTFQIGSQGVISSDASSNSELEVSNNVYRNAASTPTYLNSFAATKYAQYRGEHRWSNAPSGTAGNAATLTQAMTLDASGNLLVGTTSAGGRLAVTAGGATQSPIVTSSVTGDTIYQAILVTKFDNNSTTSQNFIQFQINNGGANCGKITANGANTAAFGSTSDQRVKENIVELPSQLANILALRPVEYDYLESYGGGHQIGFIAQEMQQVYPDVISEDDSSEKIMSITGWSKTEARLVKAIQEQQALIQSLKARLDAANL